MRNETAEQALSFYLRFLVTSGYVTRVETSREHIRFDLEEGYAEDVYWHQCAYIEVSFATSGTDARLMTGDGEERRWVYMDGIWAFRNVRN